MIDLTANYPVPVNYTWDIHDASKLQEYMTCPRKYFYRYVLGMEMESLNHHLIFGEAVHRALAVLADKGYDHEEEAAQEFLDYFREHIPPEYDDGIGAKAPSYFLEALPLYIAKWEAADSKQETVFTEISGNKGVPVGLDRVMHFRMDQIVRTAQGRILGREHKTGSYLSPAWIEQWPTKTQVNLYLHVLNSEFGPENVDGLEINGIICQKGTKADRLRAEKAGKPFTGYKFERLLVVKTAQAMQDWLWTVNWWLDQVTQQFENLKAARKDDIEMRAFPMNTESCVKYNRPCPYLGFCSGGINPIKLGGREQPGYKTTFWDPTDYREDAKTVLDLEEK